MNSTDIHPGFVILAAFLACLVITSIMSLLARPLGLVDKPTLRKRHSGEIPVVGGISIYLSLVSTLLLFGLSHSVLLPLYVGSILVFVGLIDDKVGLSAMIRFPIQAATALGMVYFGQFGIESIGNVMGFGQVILPVGISIGFTIMCTVGVINSINMIDGVDGLSGTIMLLTLVPINYFCWVVGDTNSVIFLSSLQSAIVAFLVFNLRIRRVSASIFLGDTGSMLFGFVLVWYLIKLTQGEYAPLSPVAAGWIFGLPLADTIAVMVGRVIAMKSPFSADRTHFHYKLLDAGVSVNRVVLTLVVIHSAFVCAGLLGNLNSEAEPYLFWIFTLIVVAHYFLTDRILNFFVKMKPAHKVLV